MCQHAVRDWLVLLTMEMYLPRFVERGYDSIANCKLIITSDLIMLGIDNLTHRKLLLDGVQLLINSTDSFMCTEPCELHAPNSKADPEPDSIPKSKGTNPISDFTVLESFKSSAKNQNIGCDQFPPPPTPSPTKTTNIDCDQYSPPTKPDYKVATKIWQRTRISQDRANLAQPYVPLVKMKISYTCSACPHLKFSTLAALEEHLDLATDGLQHEPAMVMGESFDTAEDSPIIEIDTNPIK